MISWTASVNLCFISLVRPKINVTLSVGETKGVERRGVEGRERRNGGSVEVDRADAQRRAQSRTILRGRSWFHSQCVYSSLGRAPVRSPQARSHALRVKPLSFLLFSSLMFLQVELHSVLGQVERYFHGIKFNYLQFNKIRKIYPFI